MRHTSHVPSFHDPEVRLARVERGLRRARALAALACASALVPWIVSFGPAGEVEEIEHLRVRRLELVDDAGVVRLSLDQDPVDPQRRSRSAGLRLLDSEGTERGGFATFDDGSVVLALDAPRGVGDPMRDRLGLRVGADGASHVMLLDNRTRAVAKLHSDGAGGGGVQVFQWDHEAQEIRVKTLAYDGEKLETLPMGR